MNANAYEITMPSNYSEMDTNELEYDGGFNWGLALAQVAVGICVIGCAVMFAGAIATSTTAVQVGGGMAIGGLVAAPVITGISVQVSKD